MDTSKNVLFVPQHEQVRRIESAVREYRAGTSTSTKTRWTWRNVQLVVLGICFAAPLYGLIVGI